MSAPMNCGILTADKAINPAAIEKVWGKGGWSVDGNELEVNEFYAWDFDDYLKQLFTETAYVFNGTVSYYGDFDGRYDVTDNNVENIAREDFTLHDADDETLISILESGGYKVIRKGD